MDHKTYFLLLVNFNEKTTKQQKIIHITQEQKKKTKLSEHNIKKLCCNQEKRWKKEQFGII